ncbi:MAG: hypothetical protein FJ271_15130 [Planctomycetes bacterium]|nr:hypothetical protein [Planctomycetota bacterium]
MSKKNVRRKPTKITPDVIVWDELVAHEPRLNDRLIEALSIPDDGGYFCRDEAWQGRRGIKDSLSHLVGFGSCHHDSFLATQQAWDVARDALLEALPPCRNCGCCVSDGSFS